MRKLCILIFLPVSLIVTGCKKSIPVETEPNNNRENATILNVNGSIRGFINSVSDRDYYRFSLTEDSIVEINLSGLKGVNLSFRVLTSGTVPELLKHVDDNRKSSPEMVKNLFLQGGEYFIVVMHGARDPRRMNRETAYILNIKAGQTGDEEREPNDRPAQATLLREGKDIRGYFSPRYNWLNDSGENKYREEDYYRIEINNDAKLPAKVNVNLTGVKGVNSILSLYDSEMKLLGESPETEPGKSSAIRGMGIKKPGTYYILVTTKKFDESGNLPYSLSYVVEEYSSSEELEPNNKQTEANTINENMIRGSIASAKDSDFFLYRTAGEGGGKSYRIEITPEDNLDLMMKIYQSDGKLFSEVNNRGNGKTEIMPNFFTESDFIIEVTARSFSQQQNGNYTLTISGVEGEGLESEPNNRKESANPVGGERVTGYISGKRDRDYFLLSSSNRLKYRFRCTAPEAGKIKISVTDPLGYKIKTVYTADKQEVTFNEMIDRKGYIIVESVIEDFDNPYTIEISEDTR